MILETIESEGLAHLSYFIADEDAGVAAVIDPRRDVGVYLRLAREHGVRVEQILETHIHADFVSGSRELADRTGGTILVGASDEYEFDHEALHDGDEVEVGSLVLRALHTPGHSPEHVCFAIRQSKDAPQPWAVFTGDTLFAGSVGRPDLAADHEPEELARDLYRSIHEVLLPLGDEVLVYPAHGAGSPCGADIGEREVTTLGYERRHGDLLQIDEVDEFVRKVLADAPEAPTYYSRMKEVNARGPEVVGGLAHLRACDPDRVQRSIDEGDLLVDTREIECFGAAHVAGSINLALRDSFPVWAGWTLDPEQRVWLLCARNDDVETVQRHLYRIGIERLGGHVRGGMRNWIESGLSYECRRDLSVHELRERLDDDTLQLLDVRSDSEWDKGAVHTARHIYAPRLQDLDEVDESPDPQRPVAVYCGSGYRASLAASLLERQGFESVHNVLGGWKAWRAADYPVEDTSARSERANDARELRSVS